MFIPADIRRKILHYFFKNGVIVVSANNAGVHEELNVLNIYVFQIGRSFVNRGFAKKQYVWNHAYYVLNEKGVRYLQDYFGLSPETIPLILKSCRVYLLRPKRPRPPCKKRYSGFIRPGRGNFCGHKSENIP
ncbi:Plectin/S10 domain containing protein [Histomonas meleagridis]|uniref:Plectin/S10 domain containing protein n=1 Tax=Histomonas meleagridis TaxID=135588 RepID=UPI00355A49D5|nr:Plectin/S10 domain containing protein [Histomonas meleagridis]KAH0804711.1 Plectin/S10 domain containing protein [Histomonas meleagridis]